MDKNCTNCFWSENDMSILSCHLTDKDKTVEATKESCGCNTNYKCKFWQLDSINNTSEEATAECAVCKETYETRYYKVGMIISCPECGNDTEVKLISGCNIGRQITFHQFERLIQEDFEKQGRHVGKLIKTTEQYLRGDIRQDGSGLYLNGPHGEYITLQSVHEQIQSSGTHQTDIYNAAMDIWK